MATGDAAAAAGLSVVAPTADARLGYDDINRRGDELANHIVNGTHPFTKITGSATSAQIGNGTVTNAKLADGAVTADKLSASSIAAGNLAPNAVTTTKIADQNVTEPKLANSAVSTRTLASGAVTTAKLAAGAVTTNQIADGDVTGAKMPSTLSRGGTWNVEATTLVLRDNTNTDKLTLGAGFDLQTNQTGDISADGVLSLDGGAVDISAAGLVTVQSNTKVEVTSPGPVLVDAGTAMTLSAGANLVVDAAGIAAVRGGTGELLVQSGGVYSETIYGDTTSGGANVVVSSDGHLRRSTSSARYKTDIQDAPAMPTVLDIQPRVWADKNDPSRTQQFGAIAEELDALGLSHLVVYTPDGLPEAIAYDRIVVALIPEVRKQRDLLTELAARVAALEEGSS
jgi:hypothetical protein